MYELFRANTDLPNRPVHLLLPTGGGLFYLSELVEDATDTRLGLVQGDLLLEDFNLQPSSMQSVHPLGNPKAIATTGGEFLLFAVAILNPRSTPQLVANYLQQNFHFLRDELPHDAVDGLLQLTMHSAARLLPDAVDQDVCQLRLLPHVRHMQEFGRANHLLVKAEEREEREQLLRAAHLEAKQAKLALKKQENKHRSDGHISSKVRRALAYFEFVCDSTSDPHKPRVAEERLDKLWQCLQLFEEWKICKGGRLIDAESNARTVELVQRHQDATISAFEHMMHGGGGKNQGRESGPLTYPIICLDRGMSSSTRKLVLKLGTRLGLSEQDDFEYGLVLSLDQDFDAFNDQERDFQKQQLNRNVSKKTLALLEEEDNAQRLAAILTSVGTCDWRTSSSSRMMLSTATDLLRPPFHHIRWLHLVKAYKRALQAVAFQSAKLEEFNAFAKPLQDPQVVMGKAQQEKWRAEVEVFAATLDDTSTLSRATQQVLLKKGPTILRRRAQQRRQQLRDQELEFERLRKLQEENAIPKASLIAQLKATFIRDEAPKVRALLEPTPAERLAARAGELLGKVSAKAAAVALAAKKEYAVRSL